MAKSSHKAPTCPRCSTELQHNDLGAWCPNYPCRYVVNRARAVYAAKVVRLLWGPIR